MEEEKTEEFVKEKKALNFFKQKFNWIIGFLLLIILTINVYIRTLPMKINPSTGKPYLWDITQNNWTLGPDLDPFFFLRWAKEIVVKGSLPVIDMMRNVPLGYTTSDSTTLLPQLIAKLYGFLHIFSKNVTVEYSAVLFPVIASVFTCLGFFFLVKEIFKSKGKIISGVIALISSAFLVTLPSLLPRTIAGIPEKESIAFGLMFFAFYFVLKSWKSEKMFKTILFGILGGFFTGMMALIWGGVLFIFVTMAIAGFIAFMFGKVKIKEFLSYSSWLVSSVLFWLPFTSRYSLTEILTSSSTGIAIMVFVFMGVYLILERIPKLNFKKVPLKITSIVVSILLLVIASSVLISPMVLPNIAKNMINDISNPYSDRLAYTVAENAQPSFGTWKAEFGPIFNGMPVFFWLFFIGSIFLFYETIKHLPRHKILLTSSYLIFLTCLVFSNYSSASILNGNSGFSLFVYFSGFLIFFGCIGYVLFLTKEGEQLKESPFEYLFLFSLILVGIIAGRSAIRLIMLLAPIAVIPLSFLVVHSIQEFFRTKTDWVKMVFAILSLFLLVSATYTIYYNYKVSEATAQNYVPSSYTIQWQRAMSWVRVSTPVNSVFAHWWDYGYWVQSIGERATILDGGNSVSYWNYLMGRHVLTGQTEQEALDFLWNHNASYLLIDPTDVGKYGAYSNIGSDEKYDRYSWIGEYLQDESQTQETRNSTTFFYFGGVTLDEDFLYGNLFFPSRSAGIGALVVNVNNNGSFSQPYSIVVYNKQQYNVKLRYLYYNGSMTDFGSGMEGAVYLIPRLVSNSNGGMGINPIGAAFYLSKRNLNALWVRLYLLGEQDNFELVRSEQSELVLQLKSQGVNVKDFVYYDQFYGPIKIWKVHYTGLEKEIPEYLQKTYPQEIKDRKYV